MEAIAETATQNVTDCIRLAIKHAPPKKALVMYDLRSPLSRILEGAYRAALPHAAFLDFDTAGAPGFFAELDKLTPGDLVVLVQSANFRLDEFRVRIELFKRGLATIDHTHLERSKGEREEETYIRTLAYDAPYYDRFGHGLKKIIDSLERVTVSAGAHTLVYEGGMEPAKLNIGQYEGMQNVGGTFPIGEVFSEPHDLEKVNGETLIFAFADSAHIVHTYDPFPVKIERGVLTALPGAPEEFLRLLDLIRADEAVIVREFGLGLNPAIGPKNLLSDVTAFERQKGLHLSLGEKHGIYKKPGLIAKKTRYHIDVFVAVDKIEADGVTIYENGEFIV